GSAAAPRVGVAAVGRGGSGDPQADHARPRAAYRRHGLSRTRPARLVACTTWHAPPFRAGLKTAIKKGLRGAQPMRRRETLAWAHVGDTRCNGWNALGVWIGSGVTKIR